MWTLNGFRSMDILMLAESRLFLEDPPSQSLDQLKRTTPIITCITAQIALSPRQSYLDSDGALSAWPLVLLYAPGSIVPFHFLHRHWPISSILHVLLHHNISHSPCGQPGHGHPPFYRTIDAARPVMLLSTSTMMLPYLNIAIPFPSMHLVSFLSSRKQALLILVVRL